MEKRKDFKYLIVWKEMYAIAANIVKRYKRQGEKDELSLINMTQGAFGEIRYCTIPLKGLNDENIEEELYKLIEEASKLLNAYCRSMLNPLNT